MQEKCLVLFSEDIRFQLKNFSVSMVETLEMNWARVRKSIISAFRLFVDLGFNDTNFRAKNAAIPIIYYIYNNHLSEEIIKSTYSIDEKKKIAKWLTLSYIRSIFGGQTDQVLTKIRRALRDHNEDSLFPYNDLISAFNSDPARNYNFDLDFIENLVYLEYGTIECDYVLYLLYPNRVTHSIHRDHMHPKSFFENMLNVDSLDTKEAKDYAREKKYWNSVLNLQLLDVHQNTHKQDKSLANWATEQEITKNDLLINSETSLAINDFLTS